MKTKDRLIRIPSSKYLFAQLVAIGCPECNMNGLSRARAVIGFLYVFGTDMIMLGTSHIMQFEGAIIDILAATVSMGLTGGVVGWMLGR